MSSEVAIKVEGLGKCYQIYDTPRDRLKQFVVPPLQRSVGLPSKQYCREFWALKDVSFEVKKSETVGIIGRNGSGKSTLLQIICGTLSPSSGIVRTCGRIAALLELGSGFNPEFTGRENVYMYAAVLGLSADEVEARFDLIADFADIGDFVDQPLKTYSSGMIVRLAFSVAINVDPDVLIVDEALAVGDELFQRKCFARIEAIRKGGATILFVSHSGGAIVDLCDRAILLDTAELLSVGKPKDLVAKYQKLLYCPQETREELRNEIKNEYDRRSVLSPLNEPVAALEEAVHSCVPVDDNQDSYDVTLKPQSGLAYTSLGALIEDPAIYALDGRRVNNLTRGRVYRYRFRVAFERAASCVRFGMLIKTVTGFELGGASTAGSGSLGLPVVEAGQFVTVDFEFCCRLNSGLYFLNAGVLGEINGVETYLHRLIDAQVFRVNNGDGFLGTGVIDFDISPSITKISHFG
jgi:lipopolysaccharide transport system ATP-binding protein